MLEGEMHKAVEGEMLAGAGMVPEIPMKMQLGTWDCVVRFS